LGAIKHIRSHMKSLKIPKG